MEKIKTYVIIISEKFPKTHPKAGCITDFELAINHKLKIHTIRLNFTFWEKRIAEVQAGRAYLSIRKWSGKPYASPQIELFKFDKSHGVGIEKLTPTVLGWFVDDFDSNYETSDFAMNDGLTKESFEKWFKKVKMDDDLAIIHFTNFRYNS